MTFANDYSLVGFWPLHEPSGSPFWFNYAPRTAIGLSGQNFDFHVARSVENDPDSIRGAWPGYDTEFDDASGTTYGGLRLQGRYERGNNDRRTFKYLVCGDGNFGSRRFGIPPDVTGSGFTVGIWINPRTDGWGDFGSDGPGGEQTLRGLARAHGLLTRQGDQDNGFTIGVSGLLTGGYQYDSDYEGGPHQLRAFLHGFGGETTVAGGADSTHIDTPIESGRPVHLTFVHEVDNGSSELYSYTLYKDGQLVGTNQITETTDSHKMVIPSSPPSTSQFGDTPLALGAVQDEGGDTANAYNRVNGWQHLVSGVYWFERPLSAVEVEELHGAGGLQPDDATHPIVGKEKAVTITDHHLVAYYPFQSPGYVDASRNHFPMIYVADEGGSSSFPAGCPSAFDRGGVANTSSNPVGAMGTISGVANALMDGNGSFTIGCHVGVGGLGVFGHNAVLSLGAIGSTETSNIIDSIGGIQGGPNSSTFNHRVRFYQRGVKEDILELSNANGDLWRKTHVHYGVVHDAQTNGVALYIDGLLQESGTLTHAFGSQMNNLFGSGYPIYFMGGVDGNAVNSILPDDFVTDPAEDMSMADVSIFRRPLEPQEMRALAVSGIDTSVLSYTVHDPSRRGFWKGTEPNGGIIPDRASPFQDNAAPLSPSVSEHIWQHSIYEAGKADNESAFFEIDYFGRLRDTPPELASFGNLGMTSGAWSIKGGSRGMYPITSVITTNRRSSFSNPQARFDICHEDRDQAPQNFHEEFVLSFEVTPSGAIPPIFDLWSESNDPSMNCILWAWHEGTQDAYAGWLTSINANSPDPPGQDAAGGSTGPSGVTMVFGGTQGGTSSVNLSCSGNLVFGVPNRVLFHVKSANPYVKTAGSLPPAITTLYVDGQIADRKVVPWTNGFFTSNDTPNSTSSDWVMDFGGIAVDDTAASVISAREAGFGDIYMRNAFIMRGRFTEADLEHLATNGINESPSIQGYVNNQGFATTSIATTATNLEAYCRFAGGQSGALDLTPKEQPLVHLAREIAEANAFASVSDNTAHNLRYVGGPLAGNDLNLQCSGITFAGDFPVLDANAVAPFVASGEPFTKPDEGFTVAFWYAMREDVSSASSARVPVSFGRVPTGVGTTQSVDASWAIVLNSSENFVMQISLNGDMNLNPIGDVERQNSIRCGNFNSKTEELDRIWNTNHKGFNPPGHLDSWDHYAWTYDPTGSGTTRAYFNGVLSHEVDMAGQKFRRPTNTATRMISLMAPMIEPWEWDVTVAESHGVLTDFAYFSAPLTHDEVRFLAYNGIISPFSTEASGIIGGFSFGQDTGSGIVGSYVRSQDTGSGILGGYQLGSIQVSGIVGGFSSGVIVTTGMLGGYLRAQDTGSGILGGMMLAAEIGSGIVGGYLQAQDLGSGLLGGHMFSAFAGSGIVGGMSFGSILTSGVLGGVTIGGLAAGEDFDAYYVVKALAAQDFDAQLESTVSLTSDFDAKAVVFQEESIPLVEIIIPGQTVEGLVPPFNQYFIGKASGTQDKTITKTIWNFGDLSPTVEVAESGAGCYPVQHNFAQSGFYVVRFTAIDSDGIHNSATRFVNAASGIPEALISLSGVPQIGEAALNVAFETRVEALPPGVSIVSKLLTFDDGQTTTTLNPIHGYTEPGVYRPVWCIRDSRGFIWCDSLEPGIDFYKG